jgi:hypothetical protein
MGLAFVPKRSCGREDALFGSKTTLRRVEGTFYKGNGRRRASPVSFSKEKSRGDGARIGLNA